MAALGSPAVVQPRGGRRTESCAAARLGLLVEPMKVDLPAPLVPPGSLSALKPPWASTSLPPPGLAPLAPPGSFALLGTPPPASPQFTSPAALTPPPGLGPLPPSGAHAPLGPPGYFAPLSQRGAFAPPGALAPKVEKREVRSCSHEESDNCSTSAGHESSASDGASEASNEVPSLEESTTMAILNIPYTYPKWKLQRQMEIEGYTFNYFHFPGDSRRGRNRGFAFVNFTTPEMAQAFRQAFDNLTIFFPGAEEKAISVVPSSLQGLENNSALHPNAAARPLKPTRQRH